MGLAFAAADDPGLSDGSRGDHFTSPSWFISLLLESAGNLGDLPVWWSSLWAPIVVQCGSTWATSLSAIVLQSLGAHRGAGLLGRVNYTILQQLVAIVGRIWCNGVAKIG